MGRGAGFARRHNEVHVELHSARTSTLAHAVPTGQDPAVLLSAPGARRDGATVQPDVRFEDEK